MSGGIYRHRPGQLTSGFWGAHTSTVDFCELNYEYLPFITEFWNTLSSLTYVAFGLLGCHFVRQQHLGHEAWMCYAGLVVVGIGSALFHATLKHEMQLLDSFPMMWEASLLFYCSMKEKQDAPVDWLLATTLVTVNLFTLLSELLSWHAAWMYVIFGGLIIAAVVRLARLFLSARATMAPAEFRQTARCGAIGAATFAGGFLIWNLDNIYCDVTRPIKDKLGLPLALLLEGHVWWHAMTSLGAYLLVTPGCVMVLTLQEPEYKFQLSYTGPFGLAIVTKTLAKAE